CATHGGYRGIWNSLYYGFDSW
nr:immunoglobulin heavy chain junction region [Macaca mulatta]MOX59201.1 immunoglobulin heavy chain junction region [Macaca mulatta]MOX59756.1 immunoglobulin heavy chain junction region [Macaca mulatta]MOX60879.1 immunoglobulin heavy chain junction region [Macaca mulatta]MOX61097.1 immunoglobulin heavy chain junction region [Macaca mulatta]